MNVPDKLDHVELLKISLIVFVGLSTINGIAILFYFFPLLMGSWFALAGASYGVIWAVDRGRYAYHQQQEAKAAKPKGYADEGFTGTLDTGNKESTVTRENFNG